MSMMLKRVQERELGKPLRPHTLVPSSPLPAMESARMTTAFPTTRMGGQINKTFHNMFDTIQRLKAAMDSGKMGEVSAVVHLVMERLLADPSNPEMNLYEITASKKEERDLFISLGGLQQLLRFFEKPFGDKGKGLSHVMHNRNFRDSITYHAHVWNDVFSLLREIIFSVPNLPEHTFCTYHIQFLFALLAHNAVFEFSIHLLEEILGGRTELFSLSLVPDLNFLIEQFSLRQLAHFCKVVAQLLLEPEERQIVEHPQMLRGVDLLNLRRDRLLRPNSTVEGNQSLVVEAPQLLEKLVFILRIANYAPSLGNILTKNKDILSQQRSPVPSELMTFHTAKYKDYQRLEVFAQQERGITGDPDVDDDDPPIVIEEDIGQKLLDAFVVENAGLGEEDRRIADMTGISNVMQMALQMGLGKVTQNGQQLMIWAASQSESPTALNEVQILLLKSMQRAQGHGGLPESPTSARQELQFHSMLLAPYSIEVLFVLYTMLTSRRKIYLQDALAKFDMAHVLLNMFNRMSWFETFQDAAHTESHGPGCECNPGTALRVQYLRLVHNFFDSDFMFNSNKKLMLSQSERTLMRVNHGRSLLTADFLDYKQKGLMTRLIAIHQSENVEAPYKFWLSLCIEAYARGSTGPEQIFLARSGTISFVVKMITGLKLAGNQSQILQSNFDLLGELVRYNKVCIDVLNSSLDDIQFTQFMDVVLNNLVESNVFLTALYVSLEVLDFQERRRREQQATHKRCANSKTDREFRGSSAERENKEEEAGEKEEREREKEEREREKESEGNPGVEEYLHPRPPYGYLTHSWVKFAPKPLSKTAILHTRALSVDTAAESSKEKRKGKLELEPTGNCQHGTKVVYSTSNHPVAAARRPPSPPDASVSSSSTCVTLDKLPSECDDFGTPPEEPAYLRLTHEAFLLPEGTTVAPLSAVRADLSNMFQSSPALPNQLKKATKSATATPASPAPPGPGWVLSDEVFRIGMFLMNERNNIIMRLMDVVNIRSVNHENVCCVHTALTMLIMSHRRGQLASTLDAVRTLADDRVKSACLAKLFSGEDDDDDVGVGGGEGGGEGGGGGGEEDVGHGFFCAPCSSHSSGGDQIMQNFRCLVWFWREYYLRRGRDRLSIEFNTRIPFRYWLEITELLCADDGSPTSLLKAPCSIIRSPYATSTGEARPFDA